MSHIRKSDLFKRQITLSEIGENGQQKLQDAKILVVGCGGLGSLIAVYLGSSGVGKLHGRHYQFTQTSFLFFR